VIEQQGLARVQCRDVVGLDEAAIVRHVLAEARQNERREGGSGKGGREREGKEGGKEGEFEPKKKFETTNS
jgi:hypothetical protein